MAISSTTLAAALGKNDVYAILTSGTGVVAGGFGLIGNELVSFTAAPVGGAVYVRRGLDGSAVVAHAAGEIVQVGLGSDIGGPSAGNDTSFGYQNAGNGPTKAYTASGAIDPVPHNALLVGAGPLAMTLAAPTQLTTGTLTITSSTAAAHTITVAGGLGGGGASFDVITMAAMTGQIVLTASNGKWVLGNLAGGAAA
jgi:hypothetical protein